MVLRFCCVSCGIVKKDKDICVKGGRTGMSKYGVDKTEGDLQVMDNPLEEMKKIINTRPMKKLVQQLEKRQADLRKTGQRLEDYLIVGDRTLNNIIHFQEGGAPVGDKAVAQYAALYIGASEHAGYSVSYINPKGLNMKVEPIILPKSDSLFTQFMDWLCQLFNIDITKSDEQKWREEKKQEHQETLQTKKTMHQMRAFTDFNRKSVMKVRKLVEERDKVKESWIHLFTERYPNASERDMLDVCLRIVSQKFPLNTEMDPEEIAKDPEKLKIFREAGKQYEEIKNDKDKLKELKNQEIKIDYSHLEQDVKEYSNGKSLSEFKPLEDPKLRERMIKASPLLEHFLPDSDNFEAQKGKLSLGILMPQLQIKVKSKAFDKFWTMWEEVNSGKSEVSLKEEDFQSALELQAVLIEMNHQAKERGLDEVLSSEEIQEMDDSTYQQIEQSGKRSLQDAMMYVQWGLEKESPDDFAKGESFQQYLNHMPKETMKYLKESGQMEDRFVAENKERLEKEMEEEDKRRELGDEEYDEENDLDMTIY